MAYQFKKTEPVSEGIRRIAIERTERSLRCLDRKRADAEAIHEARKNIKKVRALLRLVRNEIGADVYRRETGLLREAAQRLSGVRDARIQVDTLDTLIKHFGTQLKTPSFPHTRRALQQQLRSEIRHFGEKDSISEVIAVFEKLGKRMKSLRLEAEEWEAIAQGIQRSYSKGCRGLKRAESERFPEHFHEWRKRAKDLWYHVRLVAPAWPGTLDPFSEQLKQLTDYLGDHHDLSVLLETVHSHSADNAKKEAETLIGLIEQRQAQLESSALTLGRLLYAEKPSAFSRRIGRYWKTWRR